MSIHVNGYDLTFDDSWWPLAIIGGGCGISFQTPRPETARQKAGGREQSNYPRGRDWRPIRNPGVVDLIPRSNGEKRMSQVESSRAPSQILHAVMRMGTEVPACSRY